AERGAELRAAASSGSVLNQIDSAAARRTAVGVHHMTDDVRGAHELQSDVDVLHFLADADGDRARLVDRRGGRKVRRRVIHFFLVVSGQDARDVEAAGAGEKIHEGWPGGSRAAASAPREAATAAATPASAATAGTGGEPAPGGSADGI